MKKLTVLLALIALLFISYPKANAITLDGTTINFDDIVLAPGTAEWVPNGYKGFNWSLLKVYAPNSTVTTPPGYGNGLLSAPNEAYNISGRPLVITKSGGGLFNFNEVWLTASQNDNLQVLIEGSLNGNVVLSELVSVNTSGPTYRSYAAGSIDLLSFTGIASTSNIADDQFVIDAPVPEPSSVALGLLGITGLLGLRRKKA